MQGEGLLSRMRTRDDYDRAFAIVRAAVARWDPALLLSGGAPADEWDAEIASLLPKLRTSKTSANLADELFALFGGRCGQATVGFEECRAAATEIILRLKTEALID
jgi:hypothetical protein